MKCIVRYFKDLDRIGELEGLFILNGRKEIDDLVDKTIEFGECLGKHSDIIVDLSKDDYEIVTEDQEFIEKFIEIMGTSGTISGLNPVEYYNGDD